MIFLLKQRILPALPVFFFCMMNSLNVNATEINYTDSIVFEGLKRTYLTHIPALHDISTPLPLLIALHGGKGTGKHMIKLTNDGFNTLSDRKGFVVIYPDGIDKQWNDGRSKQETGYRAHENNINDVGFISALIDHLIVKLNIDPKRVYVTGMSNGALMSYRLGCDLAGKITAIAPVAGNISLNLFPSCTPSRPISLLAINNVNDALVPFEGGSITGPFGFKKMGKVISVADSINFWVSHNNCRSQTSVQSLDKDPEDGTIVRKKVYANCKDGTEVVLYAIEGGGHTWPGGFQYLHERVIGRTSKDIDANEVIWNFFERHSAP